MSPAPTSSTRVGIASRLWRLLAAGGPGNGVVANVTLVGGAALMVWSAVIHLHLWSTGYRHIPTGGPLFLLQGITAVVLAVLVAAVRRVWAAAVASGFVVSTIAGFLLSVNVGLFGFQDTWAAPYATMAFGVELATLVVLASGAALCLRGSMSLAPQSATAPVAGS